MMPQTTITDVVLAGVSSRLGADEVDAVEELAVSATEQACRNWRRDGELLPFSDYPAPGEFEGSA